MAEDSTPVERKVQLTGGSTYTVSLPKEWASSQAIEPGSTVHIYSRRDWLVLTQAQTDRDRRSATIVAGGRNPPELALHVAAAYVAGCEEIRVEGVLDTAHRRAIRDAVSGLVGIEIHEETAETIVARTMLDVADLSPSQTLVQMELTTLTMHEEAIDAVLTGDSETGRRVKRQDDDVDRLFGLICREFQRSLVDVSVSQGGNGLTTFEYYAAARQLERVADHAEKIAGVAERIGETPPEEVTSDLNALGHQARDLVRRALSGLLEEDDPNTLSAVVADAERVVEEAEALDRDLYELGLTDGYLLGTVVDSIIRTAEYGVNIAESGLQVAMREPNSTFTEEKT